MLQIARELSVPYRKVRSVLSKQNLIRSKKRILNQEFNWNYFDIIDTPEKAYFFGLIHADGCIHVTEENRLRFCINLKKEDGYLIYKLVQVLGLPRTKVKEIEFPNKTCSPQTSFQFSNQDFLLGLKEVKTSLGIAKVPTQLAPHFIRGVFDGDGTIYTKYSKKIHKYYYMGFIGNQDFFDYLNLHSPVKFKTRPINSPGIFRGEIWSKEDVLNFGEFIYQNSSVHMIRKHTKYLDAKFHYSSSTTKRKAP